MDLEIVWLEKAEEDLYNIFLYYRYKVSVNTAQRIIKRIIDSVGILSRNPFTGQREDLLRNRKTEYHHLVKGNYKLIYSFDRKHVYIHLVFDVRQNPVKLEKAKI